MHDKAAAAVVDCHQLATRVIAAALNADMCTLILTQMNKPTCPSLQHLQKHASHLLQLASHLLQLASHLSLLHPLDAHSQCMYASAACCSGPKVSVGALQPPFFGQHLQVATVVALGTNTAALQTLLHTPALSSYTLLYTLVQEYH